MHTDIIPELDRLYKVSQWDTILQKSSDSDQPEVLYYKVS
jgi:hypothetical protein